MEILYDYKPYEHPKNGLFRVETNEYKLPGGWIQKLEAIKIIGETDLHFIYELRESGHGEWIGSEVINYKYILPIGIHKSRLERWIDTQLSLFDYPGYPGQRPDTAKH